MYEGFDFLRSKAQGRILVLLVLCYIGTKALNDVQIYVLCPDLALMLDYS